MDSRRDGRRRVTGCQSSPVPAHTGGELPKTSAPLKRSRQWPAAVRPGVRESLPGCEDCRRQVRRSHQGGRGLVRSREDRRVVGCLLLGGDRPRPMCRRGQSRGGSSSWGFGQIRFCPREAGEPTGTLEGDQRFETVADKRCFLCDSTEGSRLPDQLIIEVDSRSHAYNDACLQHQCQGECCFSPLSPAKTPSDRSRGPAGSEKDDR